MQVFYTPQSSDSSRILIRMATILYRQQLRIYPMEIELNDLIYICQVGLPVWSKEAKIVSINKLICVIPPARMAGKTILKNF